MAVGTIEEQAQEASSIFKRRLEYATSLEKSLMEKTAGSGLLLNISKITFSLGAAVFLLCFYKTIVTAIGALQGGYGEVIASAAIILSSFFLILCSINDARNLRFFSRLNSCRQKIDTVKGTIVNELHKLSGATTEYEQAQKKGWNVNVSFQQDPTLMLDEVQNSLQQLEAAKSGWLNVVLQILYYSACYCAAFIILVLCGPGICSAIPVVKPYYMVAVYVSTVLGPTLCNYYFISCRHFPVGIKTAWLIPTGGVVGGLIVGTVCAIIAAVVGIIYLIVQLVILIVKGILYVLAVLVIVGITLAFLAGG